MGFFGVKNKVVTFAGLGICSLVFRVNRPIFVSERAKVRFALFFERVTL